MDKKFMDLYARFGPAAGLEASAPEESASGPATPGRSVSARKRAANRANAQRSTGPRTPEGKANSSLNHFKLGLAARTFAVLSCESQEQFDAYTHELLDQYKPANTVEWTLVLKMAQHHWLSQRALLAQDGCFDEDMPFSVSDPEKQRQLALYMRYQTNHDRAFHKCFQQLQKLQADRGKSETERRAEARAEEVHQVRIETATLNRDCERAKHGRARHNHEASAPLPHPLLSCAQPASLAATVSVPIAA